MRNGIYMTNKGLVQVKDNEVWEFGDAEHGYLPDYVFLGEALRMFQPSHPQPLFSEDDATLHDPDRMTCEKKYRELFGEEPPPSNQRTLLCDAGDTFWYLCGKCVYCLSYDGSSLYDLSTADHWRWLALTGDNMRW
jgi:hypothetical protein